MLTARSVVRKPQMAARAIVDTITLDRANRYRRRVVLKADSGRELLLDLKDATYLGDGDGLAVDGGVVLVKAAQEDLLEIRATDATALARVAWHLGNRHTPAELTPEAIYIQPDHVLEEMVAGLGARTARVRRAFEPEGGAYGGMGPLHESHHHHGAGHHHHHHPHDGAHADPMKGPSRGGS